MRRVRGDWSESWWCRAGLLALAGTAAPLRAQQADPRTTTTLVWEAHFADGEPATPLNVNGVTVSVQASDPFGIASPSSFTVEWDSRGLHAGYWKSDIDATTRGQWVTFALAFQPAARSLQFTVLDIDHNAVRQDSVEVRGWHGTELVYPTVVAMGPGPINPAPGVFSGRAEVNDLLSDDGNVTLRFDLDVDSVTFVHAAGPLTDADPTRQTIGISDLEWVSEADVHVRATAPATVLAADTVRYTVVVRNDGPAAAADVVVHDTLPASAPFAGASDGGGVSAGVVTWPAVETLPAGDSLVLTVDAVAPPTGTLVNVAGASALTFDPQIADNDGGPDARVTTTVIERADLVVRASGPATVFAAASFRYTVTVRNAGPSAAQGVVVSDTLPGGATAMAVSDGGVVVGGVVTWPARSLTAGDSAVLTVDVVAPASGALLGVAAAAAATLDPDPANNDGSAGASRVATTVIERADLVVRQTGTARVAVGDTARYTVVVRNDGPSDAAGVIVSDTLPPWLAVAAASGGGTATGGVVTWPAVALAAGDSLVHTVEATALQPGAGVAVAAATATTLDPDPASNDGGAAASRVETMAAEEADVAVRLTGPGEVPAGTTVRYTVVVTNAGPAAASALVVTDTLPAAAAFVGASAGGAVVDGVVQWTVGSLPIGDTLVLTVDLLAPPSGTLVSVVAATTGTIDPDPSDNDGSAPTSRATTQVSERADLTVRLAGPAEAVAGSVVRYTLVVKNDGPSGAGGVVVTDTLPSAPFLAASDGGAAAGGVVAWPAVATLAAGDSLVRTVDVAAPASGTLLSIAAATAATVDPDPASNDGSAAAARVTTAVSERADLVVRAAGPATADAAAPIRYTVVVRNDGPSAAAAVTVSDTLPAGLTFAGASDGGTASGRVVTWPVVAALAAGDSVVRVVDGVAPATGSLLNVAAATSATVDPEPGSNDGSQPAARVTTVVAELADLVVRATGPSSSAGGAALRYRIAVRNAGPSAATGMVVTNTLPAGAGFTSASNGGTAASGGIVTWPAVPSLAAGDSVVYTVDALAPLVGLLVNVASATAVTPDPDPASNDGSGPESQVQTTLALAVAVDRRAVTDTMTAGSTGAWDDSARVAVGGTGADTATWIARSVAPWLTLSDSIGAGNGVVRWRADLGSLRVGVYRDTVRVDLSAGAAADTVTVTLVLTAPAVALTDAVDHLLGIARLSEIQRRYLDQEGNGDGAYNLGDLLAWLDRTGVTVSADVMGRLVDAEARRPPVPKE